MLNVAHKTGPATCRTENQILSVTLVCGGDNQAIRQLPSQPPCSFWSVTFFPSIFVLWYGWQMAAHSDLYPPEGKTATGKANLTPKKAGVPYLSCNPFAFTRHTPFSSRLTLMTPYLGRFLCVCLAVASGLALFLLPKYFHFNCLPSQHFLWVVVKIGQGGVGGGREVQQRGSSRPQGVYSPALS